jgi:CRISPR/Cas system CSM-associated protein Csm3 (group 7 of RAMP superfamily)
MRPLPCPTRWLQVELLDTWHVGSGRAQGRHLDAVVDRDADGLPCVPGRMLKGLLRSAASALETWGHWPAGCTERLFGSRSQRDDGHSVPGLLRIGSAQLPAAERAWLGSAQPEAQRLRAALFVTQFQTAIDRDSGIAASQSLRGIELVLPLALLAEVALGRPGEPAGEDDWNRVTQLLPLVRALGAHKTRGHGRARLSWSTAEGRA